MPALHRPHIAFIFIGGAHHHLHLAPVAATLAADDLADVTAFVATAAEAEEVRRLIAALGAPNVGLRVMKLPRLIRALLRPLGAKAFKIPRLLSTAATLRKFDGIVTAERTSTILRRLPFAMPPMIHIPHGAGDRAVGFEPRLRLFDHVIVAGPKDRFRMIANGMLSPDRCTVSGYVKLAAVQQLAPPADLGLDPTRPTILYNPHFSRTLGSWEAMGQAMVERIVADGRFNLILAPHMRMRQRLAPAEIAAIEALAVPGRVLVDLGSARSCDMSYTRAADIYVGDVSSQVYEFIATPRPCIFLNPQRTAWRANPDYAMWRYGAVACDLDEAMAEISRAEARHIDFLSVQKRAVAEALGSTGADAPKIAAHQLLAAVHKLTQPTAQEQSDPAVVLLMAR